MNVQLKADNASAARLINPNPRDEFWSVPKAHQSIETERLYRKQRLAAAFRMLSRERLNYGAAGHITVRDPELTDHFWAHPWGMPFQHVRVSDLLLVNLDNEVVQGKSYDGNKPLSGAAIFHAGIYRARPDVISVAHCHGFYGKTWSSLGRIVEPHNQDTCAFYEKQIVYDDYQGVTFDLKEGDRIAHGLADKDIVVLKNHGVVATASSVEICAWRFISFEDACRVQLTLEALPGGKPEHMPHELARKTGDMMGSDAYSWICYHSLFQEIVREQPDLLT